MSMRFKDGHVAGPSAADQENNVESNVSRRRVIAHLVGGLT